MSFPYPVAKRPQALEPNTRGRICFDNSSGDSRLAAWMYWSVYCKDHEEKKDKPYDITWTSVDFTKPITFDDSKENMDFLIVLHCGFPDTDLLRVSPWYTKVMIFEHDVGCNFEYFGELCGIPNVIIGMPVGRNSTTSLLVWDHLRKNRPVPWYVNIVAGHESGSLGANPTEHLLYVMLYHHGFMNMTFKEFDEQVNRRDSILNDKKDRCDTVAKSYGAHLVAIEKKTFSCIMTAEDSPLSRNFPEFTRVVSCRGVMSCPPHLQSIVAEKFFNNNINEAHPEAVVFANYNIDTDSWTIQMRTKRENVNCYLFAHPYHGHGMTQNAYFTIKNHAGVLQKLFTSLRMN